MDQRIATVTPDVAQRFFTNRGITIDLQMGAPVEVATSWGSRLDPDAPNSAQFWVHGAWPVVCYQSGSGRTMAEIHFDGVRVLRASRVLRSDIYDTTGDPEHAARLQEELLQAGWAPPLPEPEWDPDNPFPPDPVYTDEMFEASLVGPREQE